MNKKTIGVTTVIIILFLFFIAACSKENQPIKETKLDALILNKEKINTISVYLEQEGTPKYIFRNSNQINKILNQLKDVTVKKLTVQEEKKFMQNGRKLQEKGLLFVDLREKDKLPSGELFIWPDGSIYVIDVKSIKNTRTKAYLSVDNHLKLYQFIF
ncbi:hypothetical protein RDV78_02550 [Bacillota bacterium LX-D]|nr:hypothetical protein [Bacillota bacterium LX-D]